MKRLLALLAIITVQFLHRAEAADTPGKTPVRTVTIGDVTVELAGSDGVTVAQIAASNGAAAGNGIFVLPAAYNLALPTNTSGRSVALQTDINGRLIITQDASAAKLAINLAQVGGASVALGQTTMAASLPMVLASDQTNVPGNLKQVSGTTVDVNTGNASAGTQRVVLASNQPTLAVSTGAPTGASFNRGTPASIGAAATVALTCKSSLTVSQPIKIYRVQVNTFLPGRCTFRYNNNGSFTSFGDVMMNVTTGVAQIIPTPSFWSVTAGSTGTQAIEANCVNADGSSANDASCDVDYCQAASGC